MNEAQFKEQLRQNGYADARVVEFEPHRGGEMHTHEFSAMLLVTSGELTLDYEGGPVTYRPGDWCEVVAGTSHCERTGAGGATALAGRK